MTFDMVVRPFAPADGDAVVELWQTCRLSRPRNDPLNDIARTLLSATEHRLRALGSPKITQQVRSDNLAAIEFYQRVGFEPDQVLSFGNRLPHDQAIS